MRNPACAVVFFYNIKCSLTVLADGSWSIGDLESKFLYDGLYPLYHFGGQL